MSDLTLNDILAAKELLNKAKVSFPRCLILPIHVVMHLTNLTEEEVREQYFINEGLVEIIINE